MTARIIRCDILRTVVMVASLVWFFPIMGCSVGMAMSGKKDPNLGAVRVGSTRGEVELQLGSPTSSVTAEDGKRVDIYEYEVGNEPSAGRAVGHAIMDVLTWGIWEVVGTPIEAVQGKKYQMTIAYDSDNRVLAINQPITSLPTEKKDENGSKQTANTQQPQQPPTKTGQPSRPQRVDSKPTKTEMATVEEKLDHIKGLKERGKITEDEYKQMRRGILGSVSQSTDKSPSLIPAVTTKKPIVLEADEDE